MKLGKVIAGYRLANSVDQRVLAKQIGVSKSVLSRIENGCSCDVKALIAILKWLLS